MISTKHGINILETGKRNKKGEPIKKPESIIFYNKHKQGIDVNQMTSYFSPLRKTIRWYHKVSFYVLLGTSVINAMILHKQITGKKNSNFWI